MSSITSNLYNNNLQSVLNINTAATDSLAGTTSTSSGTLPTDSSKLSPFSLAAAALQHLQQSDPAKYQVVTGQIATNLKTSGQDAAADGYPIVADVFNKLSTDFSTASSTGQLPTFPDLAKLAHPHPGHRVHGTPASPTTPIDSDSGSTSDPASTTPSTSADSASPATNQLLASLQANQTNSSNPTNVILSTLDSAGITV